MIQAHVLFNTPGAAQLGWSDPEEPTYTDQKPPGSCTGHIVWQELPSPAWPGTKPGFPVGMWPRSQHPRPHWLHYLPASDWDISLLRKLRTWEDYWETGSCIYVRCTY